MLSFFKSSKKGKHNKDRTTYDRENLIQTIDELNHILNRLKSNGKIQSKSKLLFQGKELDNIFQKTLNKQFGEEEYILVPDNGIIDHKIYYYRIRTKELSFLSQLHFIKDQFFLAGTKIYSATRLSNKDKQKLINQIRARYCPDEIILEPECKIEDPDGNILWTRDDVFFHINYLANNSVSNSLINQSMGLAGNNIVVDIDTSLDNLI